MHDAKSEAFEAGLNAGMEKQAGVRTFMLGHGAAAARRMGRGSGRFSSLMDRMSTRMTNKRKHLGRLEKMKGEFKKSAPGMAPSAREKARRTLQNKIQAEKTSFRPKPAVEARVPKTKATAPPTTTPPPTAGGGDTPKPAWYKRVGKGTGTIVGLGAGGAALGAGVGYAVGAKTAPPTVSPVR